MEGSRPRIFGRLLRNMLGFKRNEVTGSWREFHKWEGHFANRRKKINPYRFSEAR
jgi:hypothetical protein